MPPFAVKGRLPSSRLTTAGLWMPARRRAAGWAGVGVTLSANVTPNSWYEVTFTTGDEKLTAGDPNYAEYPFRLTIESTLSLIHISEPTRLLSISYAVFC